MARNMQPICNKRRKALGISSPLSWATPKKAHRAATTKPVRWQSRKKV